MNSFHINNLTIENFRGIPGELSLDLSAPLTVIYAANGSGKSSVCQAIEWLLTGTLQAVPSDAHKCFNSEGMMKVSAHCRLGDEDLILSRTEEGLISYTSEREDKLRDISLLTRITPVETGKDARADVRQRLKTDWLRSSRWLYSSALSLLVDNDHAERRQQIFANILGYGHLIPTKTRLESYVNALPSGRSLIQVRDRLQQEIADLTAENTLDPQWRAQFVRYLKQINHLTGTTFNEDDSTEIQYEQTELQLAQKEQMNFQRQQHLNNVLSGADVLTGAHTKEQSLRIALTDATSRHSAKSNEILQQKTLIIGIEQQQQEISTRIKKYRSEQKCLERWPALLENLAQHFPGDLNRLTARALYSVLPDASSGEQSRGRLSAWSALSKISSEIKLQLDKLKEFQRKIKLVPTPESLLSLETKETRALQDLQQKTAQFESMSTAAEQLYILGLDVARKTQSNECPLCHEPQPDHLALINRINTIQNSISPAKEIAFRTVEIARAEAETATKAHKAAIKLRTDGLNAQREYEALKSRLDLMVDKTGIRHWEEETSIEVLLEKRQKEEECALLAFDINALMVFADSTSDEAPLDVIFRQSLNRLNLLIQADTDIFITLSQRHQDTTAGSARMAQELSGLDTLCNTLRQELSSFLKTLAPLQESWRFIAGDTPCNTTFVHDYQHRHKQESDDLLNGKAILDQALVILRSSQNTKRLERLKEEVVRANDRIDAREKRVGIGIRTLETWTKHVHDIADRSLQQFLTPASELFSKMHANEVYQSLKMGRDDEAFCWQAATSEIIGSTGLIDAQSHFSQGQRQDLALSLFLARARNLKGSFFLDEPVAHLDDLNRVAMMDIFRMLTASEPSMRLVLTTASNNLRKHLRQKFSAPGISDNLRIITLEGNPNRGVRAAYS